MNQAAETQSNSLQSLPALEALLFAAGDPVPKLRIAEVLDLELEELDRLLAKMAEIYAKPDHGIELRTMGDSVALATKPEASSVLEVFFAKPFRPLAMSQAAYETLAVVAYNEPVTRAQIEQVRGVNSDGALNRLVEKGLVEMSGVLELPGRPGVFKTTELFLRLYGISSVDELEPMDMLMYGTVQDFEQSYRRTQDLARKVEAEELGLLESGESEQDDEP